MGRRASDPGGGDFEQIPAGTYIARSYRAVDIGTQHSEYNGEPQVKNQFILFWELPTEMIDIDGEQKPRSISKFYTNSLHEKANLRHDLVSWRGKEFTEQELKDFDLNNILGKPCLLTVITKNDKAKVQAVTGLPKGTKCPPMVNTQETFWWDEFTLEKFDALSDGLKKLIMRSDEYKALTGEKTVSVQPGGEEDPEDPDLPF